MSFNPENPKHIAKLNSAVDWSIERLRPVRETRLKHMAQMCGHHYSENAAPNNVPINMIDLGVSILQRFLTTQSPQCMVGSDYRELLPDAYDLELATNMEASRTNLSDAFNTWVVEALFRLGVLEVGITGAETPPAFDGYEYDAGKVFVDPVLFDRTIVDMNATKWDEMAYVGHDFSAAYDWVKENQLFDKSVRDKITAPEIHHGDHDIESESLQRGDTPLVDEFEDTITLRQIYLPRYKLLLTFAVDQKDVRPLRTINWTGPACGPYHPLSYGKVAGCVLPNAPVPQWVDLHDQTNQLWNKASNQARRQKTLLLVSGHAAADGQRVVNANDGDAIYSEDPGSTKEVSTGGADPKTFAMALQAKQMWDWLAGNISALGGLAAQSRTLGQDQMLAETASGKPEDMQKITFAAQKQVFESMAFWLYNDPVSEYHLTKPIDGTPYSINTIWTPEQRMGDLTKFNFSINPYAAPTRSPSQHAALFLQLLTQVALPALPDLQSQGMGIDWEYVFKTVAKLNHMPEFNRAIRYLQGEAYPDRGPVERNSRMSPNTTRNYVRENRPAATQQGQEEVLIKAMMGGLASQGAEMAGLMRPAS